MFINGEKYSVFLSLVIHKEGWVKAERETSAVDYINLANAVVMTQYRRYSRILFVCSGTPFGL